MQSYYTENVLQARIDFKNDEWFQPFIKLNSDAMIEMNSKVGTLHLAIEFDLTYKSHRRYQRKLNASLVSTIRERVKDISLYSMKEVDKLRQKQADLNQRLHEIEDLQRKGLLSPAELESFKELKDREIGEVEVEIGAHLKADKKTLEVGLNLIELLSKSSDFMRLDGFELEKARLLKTMLSNPTLKDGIIEFNYRKPFDDLLILTEGLEWGEIEGRDLLFLLHFAEDWAKNLLVILTACHDILAGKDQECSKHEG